MRKSIAVAVSAAGVLALTACGVGNAAAGDGSGGSSTIKVGVIPVSDLIAVYVAQDQGYFRAAGLTVETESMQNASAIVPAVMNGQLQIGTTANVPFLVAKSKNLPIQAIADGANTTGQAATDYSGLFVAKNSSITRPRDLEGKTVATNNLQNVLQLAVDEAVRKDGGDPSKIRFVSIPFPNMASALTKGQVSAISVVEPFYTVASQSGARLLDNIYTTAYPKDTSLAFYFASSKWLKSHAAEAKKFEVAIDKAGKYAQAHPEAVRRAMADHLQMAKKVANQVRLPAYGGTLSVPSLDAVAQQMVRQGFISKAPSSGDLVWQP